MLYIGIDPGFTGAWAIIDHHGNYKACGDMLHSDTYILTQLMYEAIVDELHGEDYEVVVETVHSMPKQGVASSFKFGVAYGCATALADRLNSAWHMVNPRVWKKHFGLDSDKQKSLDLARQLWPDAPLKRKKDNGRAEALLMAYWLRIQYGND